MSALEAARDALAYAVAHTGAQSPARAAAEARVRRATLDAIAREVFGTPYADLEPDEARHVRHVQADRDADER